MAAQKHILICKHKLFCNLKARIARRITDSLEGPQEYVWPFPSVQSRDSCTWFLRALSVMFWKSPRTETPQPQWANDSSVCPPSQWEEKKKKGLGLSGISHVSVCAHFLLFCHWTILRSLLLRLIYFSPHLYTSMRFPLSKANQSQFSQPLLIWQEGIQSLNHVTGSSGTL